MRSRSRNLGHFKIVPVELGVTVASGGPTRINFDKLPSRVGKMVVCVLGFLLKGQTIPFTPTASKVLDGLTLAQYLTGVTIACSQKSPAAHTLGGPMIANGINGPQLLTALHFMSGKPVIYGSGGDVIALAAGTADHATFAAALGTPTQQIVEGWLHSQGPFGGTDGTAAEWSDTPRYYLPIGEIFREKVGKNSIPASYLNGKGMDTCGDGQDAGYLEFTPATKLDNIAITPTGTVDLEAVCLLLPEDQVPIPTLPKVRRGSSSSTRIPMDPGITALLVLQKALTAGGAMSSHDYTQVDLQRGGESVIDSNVARHLRLLNLIVQRRGFRVTTAETAQTHASADRKSRWGVPLILADYSPLHAPGDVDEGLLIEVQTTGETSFDWLHAYWAPATDRYVEEAKKEKWSGVKGAIATPVTRNGNLLAESALPIADLLPGKVEPASPAAK